MVRATKYRISIVIFSILILYFTIIKLMYHGPFPMSALQKLFKIYYRDHEVLRNIEPCVFPNIPTNINRRLDTLFKKHVPIKCSKDIDWVVCEKSQCYIKKNILNREEDIKCTFVEVMFNTDYGVYDGERGTGIDYTLNKSDVVKVYCKSKNNYWSSVLIGIARVNATEVTGHVSNSLNVLIIGFASVSRHTFIKKLPLTYDYLTKSLKGFVFHGYSAYNKGPLSSLYPMLTGIHKYELFKSRQYIKKDGYIDKVPFIWKTYKENSYVTAYLEDFLLWGSPETKIQGFKSMPAHHYLRSYFLTILKDQHQVWPKYCSGSKPRYKIFTDYIKSFFSVYKEKRKFLFAFQGEMSYDDYNQIGAIDEHMLTFFRKLQATTTLDNTILMIMSDQGYNFTSIEDTLRTKQEEYSPFFYVRLPPIYAKTRTKWYRNLKMNLRRPVTPLDIHSTLKHLIYVKHGSSKKSISLLETFPEKRSCFDAGIESESCTCLTGKPIGKLSLILNYLKKALIGTMNNMTMQIRDYCAELSILSVINVTLLVPNQSMSRYKINYNQYSIMIVALPGYTVYEATLIHNFTTKQIIVKRDDIISYDFGLQSRCIQNTYPKLRKFCYCMDQTL